MADDSPAPPKAEVTENTPPVPSEASGGRPSPPSVLMRLAELEEKLESLELEADSIEGSLMLGQPPLPKAVFGRISDRIAALYDLTDLETGRSRFL